MMLKQRADHILSDIQQPTTHQQSSNITLNQQVNQKVHFNQEAQQKFITSISCLESLENLLMKYIELPITKSFLQVTFQANYTKTHSKIDKILVNRYNNSIAVMINGLVDRKKAADNYKQFLEDISGKGGRTQSEFETKVWQFVSQCDEQSQQLRQQIQQNQNPINQSFSSNSFISNSTFPLQPHHLKIHQGLQLYQTSNSTSTSSTQTPTIPNLTKLINLFKMYTQQNQFHKSINKYMKYFYNVPYGYHTLQYPIIIIMEAIQLFFYLMLQQYIRYIDQVWGGEMMVYRGWKIGGDQERMLGNGVGNIFQHVSFMSVSLSKQAAKKFSHNGPLIQITVPSSQLKYYKTKQIKPSKGQGFTMIQNYSTKQSQQQILFNNLNYYKFEGIQLQQQPQQKNQPQLNQTKLYKFRYVNAIKLFDDGLACWKKNDYMLSVKNKYQDICVWERVLQEFCVFYSFRGLMIGSIRTQVDLFVYSGFYGQAQQLIKFHIHTAIASICSNLNLQTLQQQAYIQILNQINNYSKIHWQQSPNYELSSLNTIKTLFKSHNPQYCNTTLPELLCICHNVYKLILLYRKQLQIKQMKIYSIIYLMFLQTYQMAQLNKDKDNRFNNKYYSPQLFQFVLWKIKGYIYLSDCYFMFGMYWARRRAAAVAYQMLDVLQRQARLSSALKSMLQSTKIVQRVLSRIFDSQRILHIPHNNTLLTKFYKLLEKPQHLSNQDYLYNYIDPIAGTQIIALQSKYIGQCSIQQIYSQFRKTYINNLNVNSIVRDIRINEQKQQKLEYKIMIEMFGSACYEDIKEVVGEVVKLMGGVDKIQRYYNNWRIKNQNSKIKIKMQNSCDVKVESMQQQQARIKVITKCIISLPLTISHKNSLIPLICLKVKHKLKQKQKQKQKSTHVPSNTQHQSSPLQSSPSQTPPSQTSPKFKPTSTLQLLQTIFNKSRNQHTNNFMVRGLLLKIYAEYFLYCALDVKMYSNCAYFYQKWRELVAGMLLDEGCWIGVLYFQWLLLTDSLQKIIQGFIQIKKYVQKFGYFEQMKKQLTKSNINIPQFLNTLSNLTLTLPFTPPQLSPLPPQPQPQHQHQTPIIKDLLQILLNCHNFFTKMNPYSTQNLIILFEILNITITMFELRDNKTKRLYQQTLGSQGYFTRRLYTLYDVLDNGEIQEFGVCFEKILNVFQGLARKQVVGLKKEERVVLDQCTKQAYRIDCITKRGSTGYRSSFATLYYKFQLIDNNSPNLPITTSLPNPNPIPHPSSQTFPKTSSYLLQHITQNKIHTLLSNLSDRLYKNKITIEQMQQQQIIISFLHCYLNGLLACNFIQDIVGSDLLQVQQFYKQNQVYLDIKATYAKCFGFYLFVQSRCLWLFNKLHKQQMNPSCPQIQHFLLQSIQLYKHQPMRTLKLAQLQKLDSILTFFTKKQNNSTKSTKSNQQITAQHLNIRKQINKILNKEETSQIRQINSILEDNDNKTNNQMMESSCLPLKSNQSNQRVNFSLPQGGQDVEDKIDLVQFFVGQAAENNQLQFALSQFQRYQVFLLKMEKLGGTNFIINEFQWMMLVPPLSHQLKFLCLICRNLKYQKKSALPSILTKIISSLQNFQSFFQDPLPSPPPSPLHSNPLNQSSISDPKQQLIFETIQKFLTEDQQKFNSQITYGNNWLICIIIIYQLYKIVIKQNVYYSILIKIVDFIRLLSKYVANASVGKIGFFCRVMQMYVESFVRYDFTRYRMQNKLLKLLERPYGVRRVGNVNVLPNPYPTQLMELIRQQMTESLRTSIRYVSMQMIRTKIMSKQNQTQIQRYRAEAEQKKYEIDFAYNNERYKYSVNKLRMTNYVCTMIGNKLMQYQDNLSNIDI